MRATVGTDFLRRAVDVCSVVVGKRGGEEVDKLILSVDRETVTVAVVSQRSTIVVPLEAEVEGVEFRVVFAVSPHRFSQAVKYLNNSERTTFAFSEDDESEGFVRVRYHEKFIPYQVFELDEESGPGSYETIMREASRSSEWDLDSFSESLSFVHPYISDSDNLPEAYRILQVVDRDDKRSMMFGLNQGMGAFCVVEGQGGYLKLRYDDVTKLQRFLTKSKSSGLMEVLETPGRYLFRLEDGSVFITRKTSLDGKRTNKDYLVQDDSDDDQVVRFSVDRQRLLSTLGIVDSARSRTCKRLRLRFGDESDSGLELASQATRRSKTYGYPIEVTRKDDNGPFTHFTDFEQFRMVIGSLSRPEIEFFLTPGGYARIVEGDEDGIKVVMLSGLGRQAW